MDLRTFVIRFLEAVAWPTAALIAILLLRKPLAGLLPLVRTLKYSDIEVQFGKDVADLKVSAAAATLPSATPQNTEEPVWEELVRLAAVRPRTAITGAWQRVEQALARAAKAGQLEIEPAASEMPMVLGALLLNANQITNPQYEMLYRLRQLVNDARLAPPDSLLADDASEFVALAMRMAASLRRNALSAPNS